VPRAALFADFDKSRVPSGLPRSGCFSTAFRGPHFSGVKAERNLFFRAAASGTSKPRRSVGLSELTARSRGLQYNRWEFCRIYDPLFAAPGRLGTEKCFLRQDTPNRPLRFLLCQIVLRGCNFPDLCRSEFVGYPAVDQPIVAYLPRFNRHPACVLALSAPT
jgi:hypothetical protein